MKSYKEQFNAWVSEKNIEVFNKLSDVTQDLKEELIIGQTCTFINDYFVIFPGHTIIGFCDPNELYGRCVYLDYDCYWSPTRPRNIFKNTDLKDNLQLYKKEDSYRLEIFRIPCIVESYEKNSWLNLSPIQNADDTTEEILNDIHIDFKKNKITTYGYKSPKWENFTSYLKPDVINKFLAESKELL